jgi:hypothetical protein
MTRRQKISLGMWLTIILAILLSMIARAQQYPITHVSGNGFTKITKCNGVITISDFEVTIISSYEKADYPVKNTFKVRGVTYREIAMMSCRILVYVHAGKYETNGIMYEVGYINIYKRFQNKPEEITRYTFKRRL